MREEARKSSTTVAPRQVRFLDCGARGADCLPRVADFAALCGVNHNRTPKLFNASMATAMAAGIPMIIGGVAAELTEC
ncbi:hypothetical protein [Streptomyces sp. NPDC002788]